MYSSDITFLFRTVGILKTISSYYYFCLGGKKKKSINGIFQNSRDSRLGLKVCSEHMVK